MRATVHLLRALGAIAVLMLGACSSLSVPMNEPLRSAAGNTEYRLLDVNRLGGAESALVLVALSGGGKRSAAFSHPAQHAMTECGRTLAATGERAGAGGPLRWRQAFGRIQSWRAARDAGYPRAARGEGQHAARGGRPSGWRLRRRLSGGAFRPVRQDLVRDVPFRVS